MSISGATRGTIHVNAHDLRLMAGYVSGNIHAVLQRGNAAPSGVFTFVDGAGAALAVTDDQFHFENAHEGADRWLLVVVITGETAVSTWASADGNLQSWSRLY